MDEAMQCRVCRCKEFTIVHVFKHSAFVILSCDRCGRKSVVGKGKVGAFAPVAVLHNVRWTRKEGE